MTPDHPNTAPAGWYPDPDRADTTRYWDGAQWTEHRAPVTLPPPPSQSSERSGWVTKAFRALGAAFLVFLAVSWFWRESSPGDDPVFPSFTASDEYDCDSLADEAVAISGEDSDAFSYTLLKVRDPHVVTDNRATYELPTGDGEALILACVGTGVWDDGSNTPVRLKVTVDSDGDQWVSYRGLG